MRVYVCAKRESKLYKEVDRNTTNDMLIDSYSLNWFQIKLTQDHICIAHRHAFLSNDLALTTLISAEEIVLNVANRKFRTIHVWKRTNTYMYDEYRRGHSNMPDHRLIVPIYRTKWEQCPVLIMSWQLFPLWHTHLFSRINCAHFILFVFFILTSFLKIHILIRRYADCHFIAKYIIINCSNSNLFYKFICAVLFACLFVCVCVLTIWPNQIHMDTPLSPS